MWSAIVDQRAELDAQLVLRGSHFVVVLLDDDAHLGHHRSISPRMSWAESTGGTGK
jgi:hypothetical protein